MSRADDVVLCVNSGSSSLKFALFRAGAAGESACAHGEVATIGAASGTLTVTVGARKTDHKGAFADHAAALGAALEALHDAGAPEPTAAGHRMVHGGPDRFDPARVDSALLRELATLVPFAPLHLPAEIRGIEAIARHAPALPQVVCFDTAFHRTLPEVARRLPLPAALDARGVRRYGFHGLSYEYVVSALGAAALGRAVIAHLGSGASMAAVRDGASVDTTMGLTPTGGFMMGTRTGDLDPGVLLHLLAHHGMDTAAMARLVDNEGGLRGVSGTTSDVKTLLAARDGDPAARLALAMFCYQARKSVGALAAALGGIDTLVFTGGIGEHAAAVRAEICAGLEHLGVAIDAAKNAAGEAVVSAAGARCAVRVVATDEERMIARHTRAVLQTG